MSALLPIRKKRKFDIHACFAGVNIKFPGLLFRQRMPQHHTPKYGNLLQELSKSLNKLPKKGGHHDF
jgi:hypothetical protein